jgi:O-antigen/teichoic acid export membrane protein
MLITKNIKDSVIYSLETVFSGIISIAFYILIANFLDLTDVGAYTLIVVYASIIAGVANLGLATGYERNFFEFLGTKSERGSLLATVQFFSFISIIIFTSIGILFSEHIIYFLFENRNYIKLWVLILIGANVSEFTKFYFIYLRNNKDSGLYSVLHFTQVVINFILAYFYLIINGKGVLWLGYSFLISHGLILTLCWIHQLKTLPFSVDVKKFINIIKISLPLTPRVFIGFMGSQFDKIIISLIASLDSLAIYSIASKIASAIYMLMNALGRVYQPKLYENLFDGAQEKNVDYLFSYMFVSFLPALLVMLFSKEILYFFPKEYLEGNLILIVLSFYSTLLFLGKVNGPQLLFAKRTWLISGLSFAAVILNMLITYPLVLTYGALGAAIGTLISGICIGFVRFQLAQKHARLIWNYKKIFFCYGFMIFGFIISIFIESYLINNYYQIILKIIMIFLYFYLAVLFEILNLKIFGKRAIQQFWKS